MLLIVATLANNWQQSIGVTDTLGPIERRPGCLRGLIHLIGIGTRHIIMKSFPSIIVVNSVPEVPKALVGVHVHLGNHINQDLPPSANAGNIEEDISTVVKVELTETFSNS